MEIKIHPFWRSKRTWGVIALGSLEIIRTLFPQVPDISQLIRAIFGA